MRVGFVLRSAEIKPGFSDLFRSNHSKHQRTRCFVFFQKQASSSCCPPSIYLDSLHYHQWRRATPESTHAPARPALLNPSLPLNQGKQPLEKIKTLRKVAFLLPVMCDTNPGCEARTRPSCTAFGGRNAKDFFTPSLFARVLGGPRSIGRNARFFLRTHGFNSQSRTDFFFILNFFF